MKPLPGLGFLPWPLPTNEEIEMSYRQQIVNMAETLGYSRWLERAARPRRAAEPYTGFAAFLAKGGHYGAAAEALAIANGR